MPSLSNMLSRAHHLTTADQEWVHQLVGDWQTIADVSFSDLLLILQNVGGDTMVVAQCRPATASTFYENDIVGEEIEPYLVEIIDKVIGDGVERMIQRRGFTLRIVPVRREGKVIAAMCITEADALDIVPVQVPALTTNYSTISSQLVHMVTTGEFPFDGRPTGYRHGTPRVTDGFVHLDPEGVVLYASPNAVSNYHRLGIPGPIVGSVLAEVITDVIEDHTVVDEALPVVIMGRAPWLAEVEAHGVILSLRAVPLTDEGEKLGGILLCRDVTEVRHRELELLTKDATIREINHRVKNNLQTVSALLRMQARSAGANKETRQALENAQRRVATIALVHQTLSKTVEENVDFAEIFGPLLNLARDVAATGVSVTTHLSGDFGKIDATKTTSLAVVLTELVSNAVEHGLVNGGHIEVTALRDGEHLTIDVEDDGVGIAGQGPGKGLGTKIVKTLVEAELRGSIRWRKRSGGGTRVHIEAFVGR